MIPGQVNLIALQYKGIAVILLVSVFLGYLSPGSASIPGEFRQVPDSTTSFGNQRSLRLNAMFDYLKHAKDEDSAQFYEKIIWQLWFQSDNEVIASMMEEVMKARREGNYETAIELLDVLVMEYPEYPEGWNQRATIYYLMGNLEASLRDVAETLAREPRHFGALAGRASIRWLQGEDDLARQSLLEAIRIHPFIRDRNLLSE